MHINLADQFQQGNFLSQKLDPRTKILATVLFLLSVALLPFGRFELYGAMWLFVLICTLLVSVRLGYLLRRSFIAVPFALAAITLPFTVPGETWLTLPVFGGLAASKEGTIRFASILAKSWISVQAAILLVTITRFDHLLWGLRALRVPPPLVGIISFMYRYLFILSDEALRLMRARSSRSATMSGRQSGGSLIWRGKIAGQMAGNLMLRSFERSERIYNAMVARGYDGRMRIIERFHLQRIDYISLFICLAVYIAILVVSQLRL
jgi:cobalt/nickel transport system permease protein